MNENVPIRQLRRKILHDRNKTFEKNTRRVIPVTEPDAFPKTDKMKYLETKYNVKIESVIFRMSLRDTVAFFGFEIDYSTVSKWRKYVESYLGKVQYIGG